MNATQAETQRNTRGLEITVDIEDSIAVCVEYSSRCGFLISRAFEKEALSGSLRLFDTFYLASTGYTCEVKWFEHLLVTESDNRWIAIETKAVELIPYPSAIPYPIVSLSSYGFEAIQEKLYGDDDSKLGVWRHLRNRFLKTRRPKPIRDKY
ncbi:MAG: hypothetical protein AAGA96_06690 [Verrucomicrobiota bacterium]